MMVLPSRSFAGLLLLLPLLSLGCGSKAGDSAQRPADPPSTPSVNPGPVNTAPTPAKPDTPTPEIQPFAISPNPLFLAPAKVEVAPPPHEVGAQLPPALPDLTGKPADPKPADPKQPDPKTGEPKTPDMGTPPTPKKIEYPKEIDGKDLLKWLEIAEKDPDPQVRQSALNMIPIFGPAACKPAIRPLLRMINADKDPGVRMAAITLLTVNGYEDRGDELEVIAAILSKLAQAQPGTIMRAYCLKSLTTFGPRAATPLVIAQVRACLLDPSWETRLTAVTALGSIGAPPFEDKRPNSGPKVSGPMPEKSPFDMKGPNPTALKAILELGLNDDCGVVRMEAAQSLIRCGQPRVTNPMEYAKAIEEFLKPINRRVNEKDEMGRVNNLREKNPNVQAYLYLLQIMYNDQTKKDNLNRLAALTTNKDSQVRVNAITAIAMLGPGGSGLVKTVTEALAAEDLQVVVAAMQCLAGMGKDGGSALPELEKIQNGSRDPKKPADAPKDWKPDLTMRELAKDTIDYVTGKKKFGEPEPKKEEPKKDPKADLPK
jgi:HEAT repeat protein